MRIDDLRPVTRVPFEVRQRLGIPVPVDVRFGMDDPLDGPGGFNYELTANDRAVIDQAVRDSSHPDPLIHTLARQAIFAGLRAVPVIGPAILAGVTTYNFLGRLFRAEVSLKAGSLVAHGTGGSAPEGANLESSANCFGYVENLAWNVSGATATLTATMKSSFTDYVYYEYKPNGNCVIDATPGRIKIERDDGQVLFTQQFPARNAGIGGGADNYDYESYLAFLQQRFPRFEGPTLEEGISATLGVVPGRSYRICVEDYDHTTARYVEHRCSGKSLPEVDKPAFELEDFDNAGFGDPSDSDLTPEELQNLIDDIKESPWMDQFGPEPLPPPAEPPPQQPPPPADHPRDPGWPCGGGIPGVPGGGNLPEIPGSGIPPGNINLPGGPGTGEIQIPPFDCTDPKYYPGAPIEANVGGKKRKGRIAASDCLGGTIIPEFPPYDDGYFDQARCYRNKLVVEIVAELAGELGLEDMTVDPKCKERYTGCFAKGSSMFDAMWDMMDRCGYGAIDPGGSIGEMKPLPVFHGPYHEARDFWGYTAQKDGKDIPAFVEVYRPGSPPRSVVLAVVSGYLISESKRYLETVGSTYTNSQMDTLALKLKSYFETIVKAHEVVIPYNPDIEKRHQINLELPSQGYEERAMVITVEHDVDISESGGAVTKLVVSELARRTYTPRSETFNQVWGSLDAGLRIPKMDDRR